MYSTSELDELFQILNLIEKDLNLKGLEPHWSNTTEGTAGDPNAGDGGGEVVDCNAENAESANAVPRHAHEKEMPQVSTLEPRYNFMNIRICEYL